MKILRINSSTKPAESATRQLVDRVVSRIAGPDTTITDRDLREGLPLLDGAITADLAAAPEARAEASRAALAVSDELISELQEADAVVIGAPIYNFGVPGALKAWADLVARAGVTFAYTETGPQGLLADRPVYIVAAAGGVPIGSPVDFATPWLRTFLGFVGISNVQVISADGLAMDPQAGIDAAIEQIAELPAAA